MADWFFPEVTAIKVQVPIEIEVFVAAQAGETLLLAPHVPLHLGERLRGIEHPDAASILELFDPSEDRDELLRRVANEAGAAEAQITRVQGREGIAEGARGEPQLAQEFREQLIVIDQFAGGD